MSYYVHQVPGRLRIKTPTIKSNPVKACELEQQLKTLNGTEAICANALTGSVLIHYDTRVVSSGDILDFVSKAGHFHPARARTEYSGIEKHLSKKGSAVGRALLGLILGKLLQDSPLALLTAII